ncbi:MAPEG family protein [Solimonas soli]|uniref:MAPEG family protein n=1 Tax=Solimonas soli TaxID=413479 RepID=UPI000486BF9F|nr:MAPEG family protein [Solimonas soli]
MEIAKAMLQPLVALVLWTFVMWLWMYATRVPAIMRMKMRLDPMRINGEQMAELPPQVRWKADNYNHLHEQPVLFYAVVLALVLLGDASQASVALAWAYVGVRVVHSLVQALVNKIEARFGLFVLGSLLLLALTIRLALQIC